MRVSALFTENYETVEALAVVDILRRAKITVDLISITGDKRVKSAQNILIETEFLLETYDFNDSDMLFLPGGPGTPGYEKSELTMDAIKLFADENRKIAAICAAPSVLGHLGILKGKKVMCFPGYEQELEGAEFVEGKVITDDNITTSRGMGTSIDLGLEMVRILIDDETSRRIRNSIQYDETSL